MEDNYSELPDEVLNERVDAAVRLALEKHRVLGVPSIIYDRKEQMIYEVHSDGMRVPLARKSRKGRYSEQTTEKA